MIQKFRKKPIVVDAVRLDRSESSIREVLAFIGQKVTIDNAVAQDKFSEYCNLVDFKGIEIVTLEGVMIANVGDWVIKGLRGEFYPCKPDIFEKTYDLVSGQDEDWRR